jgi:hypothetical protein
MARRGEQADRAALRFQSDLARVYGAKPKSNRREMTCWFPADGFKKPATRSVNEHLLKKSGGSEAWGGGTPQGEPPQQKTTAPKRRGGTPQRSRCHFLVYTLFVPCKYLDVLRAI